MAISNAGSNGTANAEAVARGEPAAQPTALQICMHNMQRAVCSIVPSDALLFVMQTDM